ncbi:bi-domain-containing oxidoreductase [bacterium]|nr:bi-domain-containing oxidoreductase [bacterium]
MKIISQNLKTGTTELAEIACPQPGEGHVLIRTTLTLVSPGTERMLVGFGKANMVQKALQQPDKVKMVIDKIRTDGLPATIETVLNKLNAPIPLGYCNVGKVIKLGSGVKGIKVGDRVVSNGYHAEAVCVPTNLVTKVPDQVPDEMAVFTIISSIALQGLRLAKPTLGECFVVTGLGLVGLMSVQLLRAQGCRVLGLDFDEKRLKLAAAFGAEVHNLSNGDPIAVADNFSRNRGVDGVLVTAATNSDEPMSQAAQMCRKLGRVILVGVSGLKLNRDDFFKKEIKFQVSASYGPGRYDPNYEEHGNDYPIGYVRWTENRNFEAILDTMLSGSLSVDQLITHKYAFKDSIEAYHLLTEKNDALAIILEYTEPNVDLKTEVYSSVSALKRANLKGEKYLGFIGAGNYARGVLIPALKRADARLGTLVSEGGLSGWQASNKFKFLKSATLAKEVFQDPDIESVVIATRHDTHADLVLEALSSGKNIFVEKPLCLNLAELEKIEKTYSNLANPPKLMVGFNRRFSPLVEDLKEKIDQLNEPLSMAMTINAGHIPIEHWTQDLKIGGGRIIGEACHFIDLLRFLAGSIIEAAGILKMESISDDTVAITLKFENGSIGSINYFSNGNKGLQKERLEVYCGGRSAQINNFRSLKTYGWPGLKNKRLWKPNKGQENCLKAFLNSIDKKDYPPIPVNEIFEVHRIIFDLNDNKI